MEVDLEQRIENLERIKYLEIRRDKGLMTMSEKEEYDERMEVLDIMYRTYRPR